MQQNFLDSPDPLPNFYRDLPQATPLPPAPTQAQLLTRKLREQTAAAMQCSKCGRDLWITPSGFLLRYHPVLQPVNGHRQFEIPMHIGQAERGLAGEGYCSGAGLVHLLHPLHPEFLQRGEKPSGLSIIP